MQSCMIDMQILLRNHLFCDPWDVYWKPQQSSQINEYANQQSHFICFVNMQITPPKDLTNMQISSVTTDSRPLMNMQTTQEYYVG